MKYNDLDESQKKFYDSVGTIYKKSLLGELRSDPFQEIMNSWITNEEFKETGKFINIKDSELSMDLFDKYESAFDKWVECFNDLPHNLAISEVEVLSVGDTSFNNEDKVTFLKDVSINGW